MKYNVSITKRIVLTAIIFIIGLIFLCISDKRGKLKKIKATYLGILLLIVSVFLFFCTGGSNGFVTVETDETDYSLYVNTLNKDDGTVSDPIIFMVS